MKIALAAYGFRNRDLAFNLRQIEKGLQAASGRAELVCFGESFLQGFDALNWDYGHDRSLAVTTEGEVFRQLADMTLRHGVGLLLGYFEREGERLYSSCAVLAEGKLLHNYRRISRGWKEYWHTDAHYCEGVSTEPVIYQGLRLQLALCGDLWDFPERFRTDATLIWPVYVNFDLDEWETEQTTYAKQAACAARRTLMVNSLSAEPLSHGGAFCFEDGRVAEKLSFDQEALLIVEA